MLGTIEFIERNLDFNARPCIVWNHKHIVVADLNGAYKLNAVALGDVCYGAFVSARALFEYAHLDGIAMEGLTNI